jgi:phosphoribosylanthranilate isomerase
MKLKICGMKYPDNILEVSQLLPDYMGFIFWEEIQSLF